MDEAIFPKELIEEITLENGLTLRLYDRSRRVAGDRWFVSLLAEIEVPIDRDQLLGAHHGPEQVIDDFIKEARGKVVFRMEKERNFIDEREREKAMDGLLVG